MCRRHASRTTGRGAFGAGFALRRDRSAGVGGKPGSRSDRVSEVNDVANARAWPTGGIETSMDAHLCRWLLVPLALSSIAAGPLPREATVRTRNFVVTAPTPEIARQVAD